jgi:hypothetical protein
LNRFLAPTSNRWRSLQFHVRAAEVLPSDKQREDQDTGLGEVITRATIQLGAFGFRGSEILAG